MSFETIEQVFIPISVMLYLIEKKKLLDVIRGSRVG